MKKHLIPVLILLAAVLAMTAPAAAQGLDAGADAPALKVKTTEGKEIDLSAYDGQVRILHFWHAN